MNYQEKVQALRQRHEALLQRKNQVVEGGNGIYEKYVYPILTAEHTPLEWKYDFNEKDNPFLMQRIMMNAVLNSMQVLSSLMDVISWYVVWRALIVSRSSP